MTTSQPYWVANHLSIANQHDAACNIAERTAPPYFTEAQIAQRAESILNATDYASPRCDAKRIVQVLLDDVTMLQTLARDALAGIYNGQNAIEADLVELARQVLLLK
jgi:hypothetical protein